MNNKDSQKNIKNHSSSKNSFNKSGDSSNEKKSIKINRGDIYNDSNINVNKERSNYKPTNNVNMKSRNTKINDTKKKVEHKEVSSSEAIDKMLSLGKTFFVNGTIFIAATTILVGGTIFVTGYDPIPIIEKHFIYTSKEESKSEDVISKMASIDLSKNLPSEDVFNKLYDLVNVKLGTILLDEDLFKSGRESFNAKLAQYSTTNYTGEMVTDSAFYRTLESIYSSTNRYPYSVTLTSIGSVTRGSNVLTKLSVDINAVDDDLGFHIWNLAVFLTSDNKIQDVKIIAENKTLKNTRTPLEPSLSVITNSANDTLTRSVNSFLKGITNENLYKKLVAGAKSFNDSQLKALFSKLNIKDKNYDVLSDMFEISKGNGSNFAITEVISTDFDGEPITDVILSIKSNDEVYKYDLQFNRREKTLVSISKV